MYETIGELIPLAAGIALSPFPIVAAILMLLSPRPAITSIGFLTGWLIGIALACSIFVLAAELIPDSDPASSRVIAGIVKIVLGIGLLFLAARQWRSRPQEGEQAEPPEWMAQINKMGGVKSLRFGLMFAALNPKNLLFSASAGLTIAASESAAILPLVIFTIAASLTVILPIIATLVAPGAMQAPLQNMRTWLLANNAVIMTTVLLVIGIVVISKGIGSF